MILFQCKMGIRFSIDFCSFVFCSLASWIISSKLTTNLTSNIILEKIVCDWPKNPKIQSMKIIYWKILAIEYIKKWRSYFSPSYSSLWHSHLSVPVQALPANSAAQAPPAKEATLTPPLLQSLSTTRSSLTILLTFYHPHAWFQKSTLLRCVLLRSRLLRSKDHILMWLNKLLAK